MHPLGKLQNDQVPYQRHSAVEMQLGNMSGQTFGARGVGKLSLGCQTDSTAQCLQIIFVKPQRTMHLHFIKTDSDTITTSIALLLTLQIFIKAVHFTDFANIWFHLNIICLSVRPRHVALHKIRANQSALAGLCGAD